MGASKWNNSKIKKTKSLIRDSNYKTQTKKAQFHRLCRKWSRVCSVVRAFTFRPCGLGLKRLDHSSREQTPRKRALPVINKRDFLKMKWKLLANWIALNFGRWSEGCASSKEATMWLSFDNISIPDQVWNVRKKVKMISWLFLIVTRLCHHLLNQTLSF